MAERATSQQSYREGRCEEMIAFHSCFRGLSRAKELSWVSVWMTLVVSIASACSDESTNDAGFCPSSRVDCLDGGGVPGDGGQGTDGGVDAGVQDVDVGIEEMDAGDLDGGEDPDSGMSGLDAGLDGGAPGTLEGICGLSPATLDEFEDCRVRAWCAYLLRCDPFGIYGELQDCIENNDAVTFGSWGYIRDRLREAREGARVSLNQEDFEACLRRLADETTCQSGRYPACITRWTGHVPDGETCFIDAECEGGGSRCIRDCDNQCCAGICHRGAGVGEPCGLAGECASGLHCAMVDGDFECISGDRGTPCYSEVDCDDDDWCDEGTCVADLPTGASCASLAQCNGMDQCVGILSLPEPHCEPTHSVGDRCDFFCLGPLWCDLSQGLVGECRALPAENEDCSGSRRCLGSGLYCDITGHCVPRKEMGVSCADEGCVPGSICTGTTSESAECTLFERCRPEF